MSPEWWDYVPTCDGGKCQEKVSLQRVMSYENSPVPLSLFLDDGIVTSCVKLEFMHKLGSLLPDKRKNHKHIDSADCVIYDGHASLQMFPDPLDLEKIFFKDMT